MDVMRGLRWLALTLAGLLVALVGLWLASRLLGATPAQRAALETMQAPWTPPGRNAFDAVWLLCWDVPADAEAAIVAQDMATLEAARAPITGFVSAAALYPDLRPARGTMRGCQPREPDCLAQVRADLPAHAALVDANATLIARIQALSQYDHYRSKLPLRQDAPLPEFGNAGLPLTAHAVHFAQGRHALALDGACRDIATWRRLGANSDSLIVRMLGVSLATEGHGRLLADMLQALPPDQPLPASCAAALSPPRVEEADLCRAMRGEFAQVSAFMRTMADPAQPTGQWPSRLLFDIDATLALQAQGMAAACSDATRDALIHDLPAPLPAGRRRMWLRLECAANPTGCILADIAAPAYVQYQHRAQDQNARLQLLATLSWLREATREGLPQDLDVQAGSSRRAALDALLARRPGALRSPTRDIEISGDGRATRIAHYASGGGAYWTLPLPDYLVEASAVD